MKKIISTTFILLFLLGMFVPQIGNAQFYDPPVDPYAGDPIPPPNYGFVVRKNIPPCKSTAQCDTYYKPATKYYNDSALKFNEVAGYYKDTYNAWRNESDTNKKTTLQTQLEAMKPHVEKAKKYMDEAKVNYDHVIYKADLKSNGSYVDANGANEKLGFLQYDYQQVVEAHTSGATTVGLKPEDLTNKGIAKTNAEENICWTWTGGINPKACLNNVVGWISYYILVVSAWILGFAGLILNEVIVRTIIGMRYAFDNIPAINSGWKLIRDIGNSFFIFILLYVAVTTILGLNSGNTKRLIRNIIIVGLLVNFSLFFTKVLIDASNITTIYFHSAIVQDNSSSQNDLEIVSGFSGKFAQALGITSIYKTNPGTFQVMDAEKSIILGVGGAIFLGVTAFAFLLAAVLLIIRFVVLIVLLILSPVAYFGFILPGTYQYARKWWNLLAAQLMFAPLFMIMMFLVLTLAQTLTLAGDGDLNATLSIGPENIKTTVITSEATAATGNVRPGGPLGSVFNFVTIIGFMLFAIIVSTSVASNTGGFVGSMVNRTRSNMVGASRWLGRKGYGGAKAATVGTAQATARGAGRIAGGAANLAVTSAMNTPYGRAAQDWKLKKQKQLIELRQKVSENVPYKLGGAAAYDRLKGKEGDELRARAETGDVWAQRKIDQLTSRSSGYKARLEKQDGINKKLIGRTGTVSSTTETNINTAKDEVEKGKKALTAALALDANHPNRENWIKRASDQIKTANDNLERHKRRATTEVRDQRVQFAAQLGNSTSRGNQKSSRDFIDNVRNTKKTDQEKMDERIDTVNANLTDPTKLNEIIEKIRPDKIKDLPGDMLKKPEVLQSIFSKHGKRGFMSILKNIDKYSEGEASAITKYIMDPSQPNRRDSLEVGDYMELQKADILSKILPVDRGHFIRHLQSYNNPANATAAASPRERAFYDYLNSRGKDYWK